MSEEDSFLDAKKLGNFSLVGMEIILSRKFTSYFSSLFVPSIVVVLTSWVSLLIPASRVSARLDEFAALEFT